MLKGAVRKSINRADKALSRASISELGCLPEALAERGGGPMMAGASKAAGLGGCGAAIV
jgi:hypothetical protein